VNGVWFVKMGRGTSGCCVVCMGDGVETRFVMAHDKANGKWEWQRSMGHDELGDMGMFSAHEEGGLLKSQAPPF
jgi:hypothetical protein